MKDVHIGQIIQKYVEENGLNKSELARKLNTTPQNVYQIFKRKTIDTGMLQRICVATNHNFFIYYHPGPTPTKEHFEQIAALEKEIQYLQEISDLLREKDK